MSEAARPIIPLDRDSIETKLCEAQSLHDAVMADTPTPSPVLLQLGVSINEALAELRGVKSMVLGA